MHFALCRISPFSNSQNMRYLIGLSNLYSQGPIPLDWNLICPVLALGSFSTPFSTNFTLPFHICRPIHPVRSIHLFLLLSLFYSSTLLLSLTVYPKIKPPFPIIYFLSLPTCLGISTKENRFSPFHSWRPIQADLQIIWQFDLSPFQWWSYKDILWSKNVFPFFDCFSYFHQLFHFSYLW